MNDVIGISISKNNVQIRITSERWGHIVESHDYMVGLIDLVFETISDPDFIVEGKREELMAYKLYPKTPINRKYVIVIYREIENDGFVITALMSSKIEKPIKGVIVWKKN